MQFKMRQKKVKLKSVVGYSGLFSGYSFRGKITPIQDGDLRVIQLKDVKNDYTTIGNDRIFVNKNQVKGKYYLKEGDILFISKGANNYAIPFYADDNYPSVASSAFFIVRLDETKANPNYVAWYINQLKVQQYLESQATGTYTTSINRETVENIPILLPSISHQKKIAHIAALAAKEHYLYNQLFKKKNRLIHTQLLSSIK